MPADGSSAAFGFSYQYLVSALRVLRMLSADSTLTARVALSIEPVMHSTATGKADDIVDFSISVDGVEVDRVQVKASTDPETYTLQPADAREVFDRLLATTGSGAATLLTNRPLSPKLQGEVTAEPDASTALGESYRWKDAPAGEVRADARIVVDLRPVGEVEAELEELIRRVRGDRALSQGLTSCRLLVPILQQRIFDAASGRRTATLSGTDLLALLCIPDPQIAHLAGGFDWGVPIAHVPSLASTVPRLEILDRLATAIELDPAARSPTIAIAAGSTGTGKSTLAADYCHINYNRYEFICWIDSRDAGLAEAQVRDALLRLTGSVVKPGADVAGPFCTALGRHRGPWLLVFDGASNPAVIEKYVPSAGHGSVIITTTNSLGWWTSAHRIDVEAFTTAEAIECFARYAEIPERDIPGAAATIGAVVERLGRIPLAVSMAGVYFRNTAGELDELARDYFTTLEALEDSLSIPRGYDRTLYAAVQHAIDHLGAGMASAYQREAQNTLYMGSLLAPELIPLDLVIPAAMLTGWIDLADRPPVTEVAKPVTRAVIALLRTQTIAHRVVHRDERERLTPASNTISMHPLVHEIIRSTYLKTLPPGGFQKKAIALMHYLTSWVGEMRAQEEFFALEQLRVHAEELLKLITEQSTLLPAADSAVERVFTAARALLMLELGACLAQAARYIRSIQVEAEATALLETLNEPFTNKLAAIALSDQAIDAALAMSEPEQVATPAELALPLLVALAEDDNTRLREFAFERAGELAQELSRTPRYRGDTRLRELVTAFRALALSNPERDSSTFVLIERVHQALERHEYRHVLDELLPRFRTHDLPAYTRLTLDSIEVFAHLGARNLHDAVTGMDALLSTELVSTHLIQPLHQGLSKIQMMLTVSMQLPGAPAVLAQYHLRISTKLTEVARALTELREQD
ncbi:hypothetical protein [Nocardia farcinica]|uniref:NB-ARC domain-containing protein n=1 Tax=Nocardia farcinica (strain IFM 10152) TaxID=247156 RepID=Q5Z009_NOCFA|nr:hypothetical protein [Nocardia farcinica]BAD56232.1 hypothetical protein NFA_13870 [Nocardia farcinica IFM 10152]